MKTENTLICVDPDEFLNLFVGDYELLRFYLTGTLRQYQTGTKRYRYFEAASASCRHLNLTPIQYVLGALIAHSIRLKRFRFPPPSVLNRDYVQQLLNEQLSSVSQTCGATDRLTTQMQRGV